MSNNFIPFALPEIGEEEIQEVVDTLRSGWITTGLKTRQFEKDFSAWLGCDEECISTNSATAGLHLALEAIGVGPGDEVITSPYTFTATAEVIRYLGAHPVFVDIDPVTLNIDPRKIEQSITPDTKAIIPVHIAGLPCDMDKIISIARKCKLSVIEDAAHALPARYNGNLIGSLDTDATVFSFYATKTITTGEGGMLVTHNPEIAKRCRVMRLHGISKDAFDRYVSDVPKWYYEVVAPGYKYNLTDIASAMGIHQLRKANKFQKTREKIACQYNDAFIDLPVQLPPAPPGNDMHSWHLYVLRLNDDAPLTRDQFIQEMSDLGIGCSVHFIPLHLHPYWRDTYKYKSDDFQHSFNAYCKAVSLPIYTKMENSDIDRVINAVCTLLSSS